MNIKILIHFMPWEIDYALLTYTQLKKSKYHIPNDVNITIETVLNLSSYVINWEESKLPKEFFINKYNSISYLLSNYNHINKIYDNDKLYGHLDLQRECISSEVDYYMGICPDMYFSEYLITYLIEASKQIANKYFIISPQIPRLSDPSWDVLVNPEYESLSYTDWGGIDAYDVRYNSKKSTQEIYLENTKANKWAGWCDFYNSGFINDIVPIQEDWKGYGPWDWYSMTILDYCKKHNVDFQQYILRGETICEYSSGPLRLSGKNNLAKPYKDLLILNNIPNQRQIFEANMGNYIKKGLQMLKEKNII
jgi:hypothetical protein